MENIHFFCEDIDFTLKDKTKLRKWIKTIIEQNYRQPKSINYIFTSDNYLLDLNQSYLNHNTLTDIITFDQSADSKNIEADIFISIDRIRENSTNLNISFADELHRVMIHGILHLLGFKDKTFTDKTEMRKKENHYLALRF